MRKRLGKKLTFVKGEAVDEPRNPFESLNSPLKSPKMLSIYLYLLLKCHREHCQCSARPEQAQRRQRQAGPPREQLLRASFANRGADVSLEDCRRTLVVI